LLLAFQNCLRRRDAGLLNQLQELDKQISDLRLDVEKTTDEHLETDSRPSSGFYELSDGASGSLSNSSNSVFSECLSSCHSSTCFCSPLEATLNISDGRPKSADLIGWMDYNKEGQHEDQTAGSVCRSLSTPHSNPLDVVADVHPKYQCDLVSKNGNDIYRYPSPLHAVAVQSPMFLLPVTENPQREEERLGGDVSDVCTPPETDSGGQPANAFAPQSSWAAPCPSTSKRIDSYILGLVQRKTHAVRTNKPRTSLNADPAKGILRHGSMCVRQPAAAVAHGNVVSLKSSKQVCLPPGGTPALEHTAPSPLKQRQPTGEQLEGRKAPLPVSFPPGTTTELQGKHLPRGAKPVPAELSRGAVATAGDVPKESGQPFAASPKESPGKPVVLQAESRVSQPPKKILLKSSLQAARSSSPAVEERPTLDFKSEGSSSQSLDDGLLVNAQYIPAQQQSMKLHKGTRNVKILKSSALKHRPHLANGLENSAQPLREKSKPLGKKCRFPEELDTNKKLKKPSSRGKRSSGLPLELGPPGRQGGGLHRSTLRSHGHGREVVVAKPKHKRADYRRWKSSAEISYEEALRRARRSRREGVGVYPQVPLPYVSPYAYVASDSEYSAECESLFHSTVVDTSEDEQSNYTTNCFGDSESSLSEVEFVGESTTTSDSDESGGLIWSQFVQTLPIQTVTAPELHENAAKAFVKIKASHNLKKKILRFRSGSLKLMTTV
ncbi:DACT1 protein, partial [Formicarius rufipectus]|nr:DACT1 protein [Formicarius rufipectus]